ncbi:Tetratricopeptide repeat-containing protein [Burkholderia sp. YR290]|nr:Tetratricopeptide repeat-containing protein [Burkholderia sp. YR290]
MAGDQYVSLEQIVAAPVAAIVQHWQDFGDGAEPKDATVELERQEPLLGLLDSWLGAAGVKPFRDALAAGNRNALSAFVAIDRYIGEACNQMLQRAKNHKDNRDWGELTYDAGLAGRLAQARSDRARLAVACFLVANARRGLGDLSGTVQAYERAIGSAQGLPAEYPMLAAAHDNLGNVLTELGRFDEALEHYEKSLQKYERNPPAIDIILANEAHCQLMLGEYKKAGRTLNSQLKRLERRHVTGTRLAVATDMAAQGLSGVGE